MLGKYNMNVNLKVKDLRKKNGYTQEQLAALLNMKTGTYSQMERSGKIPIHIVIEISEIFKVDISEILLDEKEEKTENSNETAEIDEKLIIETPNTRKSTFEAPPIPLINPVEDRFVLSNREENAIIMLRNLAAADREEVYKMIKVFHDKKFKKR